MPEIDSEPASQSEVSVSQDVVITQANLVLDQYARTHLSRSTFEDIFGPAGWCNGFSIAWGIHYLQNINSNTERKTSQFFDTMTEIASYDKSSNNTDIEKIAPFINYVYVAQHPYLFYADMSQSHFINITTRAMNHRLPFATHNSLSAFNEAPKVHAVPKRVIDISLVVKQDGLEEILKSCVNDNNLVLFSSPGHATGFYQLGDKYYFYDPNNKARTEKICENREALIEALKQAHGYKDNMPVSLMIYEAESSPSQSSRTNFNFLRIKLLDKEKIGLKDKKGNTSAHIAAQHNDVDTLEIILQNEPNLLTQANEKGITPLYLAAFNGSYEFIEVFHRIQPKLFQNCLNLEFSEDNNSDEKISLHAAIMANQTKTVKLLLECGASCKGTAYIRPPLVEAAAVQPLTESVKDANLQIIELLLQQKEININERADYSLIGSSRGKTALHIASEKGKVEAVKILLNNGSNAYLKDGNKHELPIMLAAKAGYAAVVDCYFQKSPTNEAPFLDFKKLETEDVWNLVLQIAAIKSYEQQQTHVNRLLDCVPEEMLADNYLELLCQVVKGGNLQLFDALLIEPKTTIGTHEKLKLLTTACKTGNVETFQAMLARFNDIELDDNQKAEILINAIEGGNEQIVEAVIEQFKLNVNIPFTREEIFSTEQKNYPLFIACEKGNLQLVKLLIDKGADLNQVDQENRNILFFAVKSGNKELVKYLVQEKALNINQADNKGETPLFGAFKENRVALAQYLISECGANYNIRNKAGHTPLYIAAEKGNISLVELLLKQADIKLEPKDKLMQAAIKGGVPRIIELFCGKQEIVFGENAAELYIKFYQTGYFLAAQDLDNLFELFDNKIVKQISETMDKFLWELVEHNCESKRLISLIEKVKYDITAHVDGKEGATLLHLAALNGSLDIVKALVEFNPNVLNLQDDYKNTPLMYAIEHGHTAMAEYLLQKDASVALANDRKRTALHLAAAKGELDLVKKIIEKEPNILNLQDDSGKTPLMYAIKKGHTSIAEYLLNKGASVDLVDQKERTALHLAIAEGKFGLVQKIIEKNPSILNRQNEDTTQLYKILHLAAVEGDLNLVKKIVEKNSSILNQPDDEGNTPLMCALKNRRTAIAQYLLEKGASTALANDKGRTALHIAAAKGQLGIVQKIVEKNPSILDKADKYDNTPLMRAIIKEEKDVVGYLVDKGASLKLTNGKGETAEDLAERTKNKDVIDLVKPKSNSCLCQ